MNIPMRPALAALLLVGVKIVDAGAQNITSDPLTWRPVSYHDLQLPSEDAKSYASIWADRLDANNRAYRARGDLRYVVGNAPAGEAHFTIKTPAQTITLTVLNTRTGCAPFAKYASANVTILSCPMRIAFWDKGKLTINEATGCYLERGIGNYSSDPSASVSYVSFDVNMRAFKTGVIVAHKPIDGCSHVIPVYPLK